VITLLETFVATPLNISSSKSQH